LSNKTDDKLKKNTKITNFYSFKKNYQNTENVIYKSWNKISVVRNLLLPVHLGLWSVISQFKISILFMLVYTESVSCVLQFLWLLETLLEEAGKEIVMQVRSCVWNTK